MSTVAGNLRIDPLAPDDLATIVAQQSQKLWLGMEGDCDYEQALHLASQPVAWTARCEHGRIIACFGINETFPGTQGVAWSLLAEDPGAHHLALTRFMARQIAACGLARLELLAKCADVEPVLAEFPGIGRDELIEIVTAPATSTPEVRWALLLGMRPAYVMRKVGFAQETYLACERIG